MSIVIIKRRIHITTLLTAFIDQDIDPESDCDFFGVKSVNVGGSLEEMDYARRENMSPTYNFNKTRNKLQANKNRQRSRQKNVYKVRKACSKVPLGDIWTIFNGKLNI